MQWIHLCFALVFLRRGVYALLHLVKNQRQSEEADHLGAGYLRVGRSVHLHLVVCEKVVFDFREANSDVLRKVLS